MKKKGLRKKEWQYTKRYRRKSVEEQEEVVRDNDVKSD